MGSPRASARCGAARCACIGATRGDPRRCAAPRGARETAGCRSERPLRSTLNPLPRAATRDDARHGARIGVARPGATRTTCCAKARSEGIARCAARQKRAAGQSAQRGKGAQRAKRAAWRGATRRAWLGAPRRAEARHGLGGAGTARLGATATDGSGARPIMAAEPAAPAHGRRSRCSATAHTIRHAARSRRDPGSPQSLVRLSHGVRRALPQRHPQRHRCADPPASAAARGPVMPSCRCRARGDGRPAAVTPTAQQIPCPRVVFTASSALLLNAKGPAP